MKKLGFLPRAQEIHLSTGKVIKGRIGGKAFTVLDLWDKYGFRIGKTESTTDKARDSINLLLTEGVSWWKNPTVDSLKDAITSFNDMLTSNTGFPYAQALKDKARGMYIQEFLELRGRYPYLKLIVTETVPVKIAPTDEDLFNYAKEIIKRHLFCDFLPSVGTYPLIKYCNKVSTFVEENKNKLDCVDTNASVIIGKVFFEIFEFSKRKGITFRFSMLSGPWAEELIPSVCEKYHLYKLYSGVSECTYTHEEWSDREEEKKSDRQKELEKSINIEEQFSAKQEWLKKKGRTK